MLEHQIRQLLEEITVKKRKKYYDQLRRIGLHIGQDQLLCQLSKEDGITQRQLSERLNCEPPTVANALKSLENHAFVERKRDPLDGRINHVYLTEKGKEMIAPVHEVWLEEQERLLQGLSVGELETLKCLLQKMAHNVRTFEGEKEI